MRVPLFDQLSPSFTRTQFDELVKRIGVSTPTRVLLSKWKAKGWIKETSKFAYEKLA